MQKIFGKLIRMFMVMAAACCITAFAGGAVSVKAAESNPVVTEQAQISDGETSEESGSGVMLLLGGMLLIILAVVITVVATVAVTAPAAADEV